MVKVLFKYGTQSQYDSLETKDPNALYCLTDSQRIYKGEYRLASSDIVFSTEIPTAENSFDNILYVVLKDGEYSMYIKNESSMDEIKLGNRTNSLTDVSYNSTAEGDNAIWTFTLSDGSTKEISTPKENFLSSASMNPDTGVLTLTLSNGDTVPVNMAELIDNTDTVKLTEDVAPIGVNVYGGIPTGGWKKGTTLTQIVKSLIQKEQDANVTNPSLSISLSGASSSVEAGTNVKPTISGSFSKGSYSPGLPADTGVRLTSYTLKRTNNGVEETVIDGASSIQQFTESDNVQIGDGATLSYKATCAHTAGATPTTNMGNASSKSAIAEQSARQSNTVNISGFRKYFYGATTDKPEINSDYIRGLTNSSGAYSAKDITVTVPAGAQRVVIACLATKTGVTKIINTSALNADVTNTFTRQTVQVEGANGYTAVDYNVWVYEPAVAYGQQAILKVTLG